MVAQSYAIRYPNDPAKLILSSTAAWMDELAIFDAFERLGGPGIRAIAEWRWANPTDAVIALYREKCFPFYNTKRSPNRDAAARTVTNNDVAKAFFATGQEGARMDFRAALGGVRCPTLILARELDPITPLA